MQVDFQNTYILAVVLFMLFIWFARNCLDLLQALFECVDRCGICCQYECCGIQCIGYNAQQLLAIGTRQCLAVFCFIQPLLLSVVVMINNGQKDVDKSSTILLCDVQLNTSLLMYKHFTGQHNQTIVQIDSGRSGCSEIDYVFLAMPFAAAVSITTLSWVKLTSSGDIGHDTVWDEQVYESPNVFFYDLIYYFEIWCMNICFVFGSSSEASFLPLYFTVQALTIAMLFFVASIRFTHDSVVEQWVGTVFTAFIVSILLPHWNESVQSGCEVSVAVAMVHAFCVFLIVVGHYIPMGHGTASYVMSLRVMVTVIACMTNLIVLLVGRNANC